MTTNENITNRQIKELIKFAKSQGVKHLKLGGLEIDFFENNSRPITSSKETDSLGIKIESAEDMEKILYASAGY